MKLSRLLSPLLLGLSTFMLLAQANGSDATPQAPHAAEVEAQEKPDINKVIKSSAMFTNSVGMVMKKISNDLWISAYETTQKQYSEVTGANPSSFRGEQHPVDSVSWQQADTFCKKLMQHEKTEDMLPDGYRYRLPSQEQWEMQAKGIPLAHAVTSSARPRSASAAVGSLPPNGAGLYDLRGNVAEWCANPPDGSYRVLRGGSWADWIEVNLRLDFRVMVPPGDTKNTYGFRCSLVKSP